MNETNKEFIALKNYQFDTNYRQFKEEKNITTDANEVNQQKQVKKIQLKCGECTRTYTSQKRYDNHIEKHHTRKCLHKCKFCRSAFKRRVKLINHCSKAHPEYFYGVTTKEQEQQQLINSKIKPSIFHNIELLAQSDSNDSSSSSSWQI